MAKVAAIYIRVSTVHQAEFGYSLDAQRKDLLEICGSRYDEIIEYADKGISGKSVDKRPEMLRLISDIKRHKINTIFVWALSRLTRSVSDLYNILQLCSDNDVSLVSKTEHFETETPMGRAMIGMIGVFAQMEREITGERVSAAMLERAMQGKRTTSYVLGYDNSGTDSMVINEEEAEIVLYIFRKYVEHKSLSAVAELCNLKGYRGKRGQLFKAESIKSIITRPVYAGYYSYKGELYKGDFEVFVSPELYKIANRLVHKRRK